jgi:hypothetical protein
MYVEKNLRANQAELDERVPRSPVDTEAKEDEKEGDHADTILSFRK